MITPQELRIGNWVNHKIVEKWERVDSIDYDQLLKSNGVEQYYINRFQLEDYEPIPLSPEILEKCGFNKKTYGGAGLFYVNGLVHISEYLNYLNCDPYGSVENSVSVQYLHQLQNLFYVLTGQELEIKL